MIALNYFLLPPHLLLLCFPLRPLRLCVEVEMTKKALLLSRLRRFQQHRAATFLSSAAAAMRLARTHGERAFPTQPVVVREFLAGADRAHRMDEQASIVFDRLAVRIATVIDPPRGIPLHARIDHRTVGEFEYERMVRICRIAERPFARDFHRRACAAILDDAGAFADWFGGKNAFAVYD